MPNASEPKSSSEPPRGDQPAASESAPAPAPARPESSWSWPNFTRNALIIGAAIALAVWFWDQGIKPNIIPKNFGIVTDGEIYRSGELTPRTTEMVVREHGIRTIVDFGAHEPGSSEEEIAQRTADALGVTRIVFDLEGDATGDPNAYVEALRIMTDPDQRPVLVHCAAGAQRTGCGVALYRSIVEGVPDEEALAEATKYRHDPEDNPRLPAMYHRYRDAIEDAFRNGGSIPFTPGPFDEYTPPEPPNSLRTDD